MIHQDQKQVIMPCCLLGRSHFQQTYNQPMKISRKMQTKPYRFIDLNCTITLQPNNQEIKIKQHCTSNTIFPRYQTCFIKDVQNCNKTNYYQKSTQNLTFKTINHRISDILPNQDNLQKKNNLNVPLKKNQRIQIKYRNIEPKLYQTQILNIGRKKRQNFNGDNLKFENKSYLRKLIDHKKDDEIQKQHTLNKINTLKQPISTIYNKFSCIPSTTDASIHRKTSQYLNNISNQKVSINLRTTTLPTRINTQQNIQTNNKMNDQLLPLLSNLKSKEDVISLYSNNNNSYIMERIDQSFVQIDFFNHMDYILERSCNHEVQSQNNNRIYYNNDNQQKQLQ